MNAESSRWRLVNLVVVLAIIEIAMLGLSALLLAYPPRDDSSRQQREAAAYEQYRQRFGLAQIGPAECRSDADLDELNAAMTGSLAPPAEYATAWQDTPAVQLYQKWLTDIALVRRHQDSIAERYRSLTRRGRELLIAPSFDAKWVKASAALLGEEPPLPTGNMTESPELKQRRGVALQYEAILDSDLVERARDDWNATKWRLTGLPEACEILAQIGRRIGCWFPPL
jgi:hypothetical protein